jgi:hypothetical protein
MSEIDRPFHFTWDFCLMWAIFALLAGIFSRHMDFTSWYSHVGIVVVVSLFAAFVLYGPVLLARQIIHSGSRGWFVLRVLISTVLGLGLLSGMLVATGIWDKFGHLWGFIFAAGATFYLNWRISNDRSRK